MYEEYFGLERPPFKITPDTSLFFEGGKRGDILAALVYAIHRGEGIIKVVGEVGSGKTMLCRMLQLKLPDTVEIVYIANPSVSAEDILFVIAHELELPVARDASKHEVMRMLQEYLLKRHTENRQVVLFVEEAQGMPLDTLEEIRLLSNLETAEHKLLQIILFGQPELDQNLSQQSIRQLRERITHNFKLEPLSQQEIHSYLNFRMRQVGYTGPELINSNVAKKIEAHSEGLLRRINIIADKILLSAFAEGTHNLSSKHVTAAVNDSSFDNEKPRKSGSLWWVFLLITVALAFALYQTRAQWMAMAGIRHSTAATPPAQIETVPAQEAPVAKAEVTGSKDVADTGATGAAGEPQAAERESRDTNPAADTPGDSSVESGAATTPAIEATQAMTANLADESNAAPAPIQVAAVEIDSVETLSEEAAVETDAGTAALATDVAPLASVEEDAQPIAGEIVLAVEEPDPGAEPETPADADLDYRRWLDTKLAQSRQWLDNAERRRLSIQVMMRKKSAARELVYYLRNEWPLDISQTYLYEVNIEGLSVYRVFYSEFDSLAKAQEEIELLPESVKVNSPYVHSVSRMRRALL